MGVGGFPQSRRERQRERSALSERAERLVAEQLQCEGFEILARNLRLGRHELDIVARRGSLLVICEVRSRTDAQWLDPSQTVTPKKRAAVRKAAAALLRSWHIGPVEVRLDVASVVFDSPQPRLTYLPGAL